MIDASLVVYIVMLLLLIRAIVAAFFKKEENVKANAKIYNVNGLDRPKPGDPSFSGQPVHIEYLSEEPAVGSTAPKRSTDRLTLDYVLACAKSAEDAKSRALSDGDCHAAYHASTRAEVYRELAAWIYELLGAWRPIANGDRP